MEDRIGEKLVKLNLLSFEQAEIIFKHQSDNPEKKCGEIALEMGFLEKVDYTVHLLKEDH